MYMHMYRILSTPIAFGSNLEIALPQLLNFLILLISFIISSKPIGFVVIWQFYFKIPMQWNYKLMIHKIAEWKNNQLFYLQIYKYTIFAYLKIHSENLPPYNLLPLKCWRPRHVPILPMQYISSVSQVHLLTTFTILFISVEIVAISSWYCLSKVIQKTTNMFSDGVERRSSLIKD